MTENLLKILDSISSIIKITIFYYLFEYTLFGIDCLIMP